MNSSPLPWEICSDSHLVLSSPQPDFTPLSGLRLRHPVLWMPWTFKLPSTVSPFPTSAPLLILFPVPGTPSLSPRLHPTPQPLSFRLPLCVSTQCFLDCRVLMLDSSPLLDLSPLRSGPSSNPSQYCTYDTVL